MPRASTRSRPHGQNMDRCALRVRAKDRALPLIQTSIRLLAFEVGLKQRFRLSVRIDERLFVHSHQLVLRGSEGV